MNRKKIALVLVLGVGGLSLAAHALFSFQVDAGGAKGLARAVIQHAGTQMGVSNEVQSKVSGLAEFGIDQAVPVLASLYQNLSAIEKAEGKDADAKLAELSRQLTSLVDLKDRVVAEAGKDLSPRERAQLIVKLGEHFHERFHPTPEGTEAILSSMRAAHQHMVKEVAQMNDAHAKEFFGAMDAFAAQHRKNRDERRALFAQVKSAVESNASDAALAQLMSDWDKVTARQSDTARAEIAEAGKRLTTAEKVRLVAHAKTRIDHALTILSLIVKFAPIKG
jgi:hypothetical protein